MIINLKNETELSGFYIIYKGSTNLEHKDIYGISHFLEHLKYKCLDDLTDAFQSNGITGNAYTSGSEIVFHYTGLEEYLAPFRDTIVERMYLKFSDYIDSEKIENEKKIVLEEYDNSFSEQTEIFYQNLFRKKFNYYSPIGLRFDIEKFNYNICEEFYNIQYLYPDMIVNISKTFEYHNDSLIFADRSKSATNKAYLNEQAPLEIRNDFPDTLCKIYYQEIEHKDYPITTFINVMLSRGLNSPLYQELREKNGLCYSTQLTNFKVLDKYIMMFIVNTTPTKSDKVDRVLYEVLSDRYKHITSERVEMIRKYLTINYKKKMINRHTEISDIISDNAKIFNDIVPTVTLEEILSVYDKYYSYAKLTNVNDKQF